jgi:PTS system nitrogen regulatory IIA component
MYLLNLLDRNAVISHVSASSKRQTLQVLADMAARLYGLNADEIFDGLIEREKLGSTGVGSGVAVPHAAVAGLKQMRGLFLRLEQPIAYDSIDEQPVDLVFALLAPKDAGTEHLRALAKVSRLLRQKALRKQLRGIDNLDALYALLTNGAESDAA